MIRKIMISGIETIQTTGTGNKSAIILLHGYGANCQDLLPLQNELDPNGNSYWYFPNGTEPIEDIPGFAGRAWFQIDQEFINSQVTGQGSMDRRYKDVDSTTEKIKRLYDELADQHENVFIGGFSQGAILATNLVLNYSLKPAGLIILSGSFLAQKYWQDKNLPDRNLPIFQSHGLHDMVLPFVLAENLSKVLSKGNENYEFHPFSGGHEIPMPVLLELDKFLKKNHAY